MSPLAESVRAVSSTHLVALLLWLTSGLLSCTSEADRHAVHLRRGEQYLAKQRPGDAIIELRSALSFAPRDLETLLRLGGAYFGEGFFHEAKAYFEEAYLIDPGNDGAALTLADALLASQPHRSQALIQEVLDRSPNSAAAYLVRSEIDLLHGRLEGALEDVRKAIALAPDSAAAHWKLERVYQALIQARLRAKLQVPPALLRRALENYGRLLELDPDGRPRALLGRARILARLGLPRAGETFREALDAALEGDRAGDIRVAATTIDRFSSAVDPELHREAMQHLVEIDPRNLSAWATLADLRERRGESVDDLFEALAKESPKSADAHILYARHRASRGDLEGAIDHLEEQIEAKIDPPRLSTTIAELQIDSARWNDARETIALARQRFPRHWRTRVLAAYQALMESDPRQAAKILRQVTKNQPEPQLLLRLAAIEQALGRYQEALVAARIAARKTPGIPIEAKRMVARIQHDAGDWPAAFETFGFLADYDELTAEDQIMLARCHYRTGSPEAGRALFLEILAQRDPPPIAAVAFAREEASDPAYRERARQALATTLEQYPTYPGLEAEMARLEMADGDFKAAHARLGRALKRNSESVDLRMLRARTRVQLGDAQGAVKDAQYALRGDRQLKSGAVQLLVSLAVANGAIPDSISGLESVTRHDPNPPVGVLMLLGQLYTLEGQVTEAIEVFERILSIAPDLAVVKNDLAFLLASDGGDLERALELAQQSVLEMGDDPSVIDTLGFVYLKRGLYSAALRQFRSAASSSSSPSAEIEYHTGLALQGLGRPRLAMRAFVQALRIDPGFRESDEARRQIRTLQAQLTAPATKG